MVRIRLGRARLSSGQVSFAWSTMVSPAD